ncbi:MAG TPA: peptidylprolyl isomerase [Candidatus Thermoplasmatota archaeon]|jgi:peptidylprolyl isomerase|nr:peptidylprolyl isomerase [Candidatus Thermoplasmatota archaeon]
MGASKGDTVAVHYTGKLDSGVVFDTSEGREPLEFTLGEGQLIPGFEAAVVGLEVGASKTVRIPAEEAYGTHDPRKVFKVERAMFGDHEVEVGQHLNLVDEQGRHVHADVKEVAEDFVTLDTNPHLAGEALTFTITVVSIQPA